MFIRELRACEGRNVFCHRPVLVMLLDLGPYARKPTGTLGDFTDKLLSVLPSLAEHGCSRGRPGGLVERLREGTYLGHVVEHVWLELMHLAGMEVSYGKTLSTEDEGVYEVVCEYTSREGARASAVTAVELVKSVLEGLEFDVPAAVEEIRRISARTELGPSTRAIVQACRKRGIPVMRLSNGSLLQLGYGARQKLVQATLTQHTGCIAADIAGDKSLAKHLLSEAEIPVPRGMVVKDEAGAVQAAATIGGPVVVKPLDGNQGKGVALNLTTAAQIRAAYRLARHYSEEVMVEEYIQGKQYRLLVVNGRVTAAAERIPTRVVGDGCHTVTQLVDIENRNPLRGEEHEKPLTRITIDPVALLVLRKNGLSADYIPRAGEVVYLRENANLSTGGTAEDVTDLMHPENASLAARAAQVVGLDVAGIDLVAADISQPISTTGGAVIEVNAAPGIRMHHHPSKGQPRDVAGAIVDYLFPPGTPARIPIICVTGTNGKTTTTRLVADMLRRQGLVVGMATTDGIHIGDRCLVKGGDTTGPWSARAVLRDPAVEAAVLETARGGLLREGLAFDRADVAVVTNIAEDHLGQGGVESLEDLAHIKSLTVEAVGREGCAVLNADDPLVAAMASRARCRVIYFSLTGKNSLVRRHLGAGGTAVFVDKGRVVVAAGNQVHHLVPVKSIPLTCGGTVSHNLQNALAATGTAWGLGIPPVLVKESLESFGTDPSHNPGRLMVREINGVRVVVDYGHNPPGFESVLRAVKSWGPSRLAGVIGVPGDRPDRLIRMSGWTAGRYCQRVFIKEDQDLRGREAGAVAALLKEGVLSSGLPEGSVTVETSELKALRLALDEAVPGDMVVVFYEHLQPVLDLLEEYAAGVVPKECPSLAPAMVAVAE
ncbi:cyanophycin synthetase [Clostridiales bacterium PH28_bin88]|nr:cyanophycin synthetase [Clostridiales bacterium PH28_bin88]